MGLNWYGVKGLFRWALKDDDSTLNVEERIVVFQTESFDDAVELTEKEALEYCEEDPLANFRIKSMGWWDAYRIGEKQLESGSEIFSRLMDTSLGGESFLKRYTPRVMIMNGQDRAPRLFQNMPNALL